MRFVRYFIGVILGVVFVYLIGTLIAWDFNPGEWSFGWRLWCVLWAILWGHFVGVVMKDQAYRKKSTVIHNGR